MGTIHQIDDFRRKSVIGGAPLRCHCDAQRAAHGTFAGQLAEMQCQGYRPRVLCLETLEAGVPASEDGWDLIYSTGLLAGLPAAAASQVIKTAIHRLKPGGRLLMANVRAGSPLGWCERCRRAGQERRTEFQMAELFRAVPTDLLAGQIIFHDADGLNVLLEAHRSLAGRAASYSFRQQMLRQA